MMLFLSLRVIMEVYRSLAISVSSSNLKCLRFASVSSLAFSKTSGCESKYAAADSIVDADMSVPATSIAYIPKDKWLEKLNCYNILMNLLPN